MEDIEFKDFYDVLRENLDNYDGDYEEFINHGPDLFKLLTDVLNENDVSATTRLRISAAIAYYVAPFDIIPETIYGPDGYIDDIFVCLYVLKEIEDEMGFEFWRNYGNQTLTFEKSWMNLTINQKMLYKIK